MPPGSTLTRDHLRMMAMAGAGFAGFAATLSALPAWTAAQGGSATAAGAVTTVMLVATVLAQPLVPAMLRRLPTARAIAIGLLLLGLPSLALLVASTGALLYAVCVVRGVGFAVLTVAGAVYITEVAPPERRGHATGLYGLSAGVPNVVLVPLSVLLVQQVGLWPVVLIAALAPTLGAVVGWTAPRPANAADQPAAPKGRLGVAIRGAAAPSTVLLAATIAGGALVTIVPIEQPSGYLATVALLAFGAASALCRWVAGGWADRVGIAHPLLGAALVLIAGIFALAAGLAAPSDPGVLAGAVLIGVAFGAVNSLTLVWTFHRVAAADRPVASTVWNASFDAGTAIGAVLIGALVSTSLGMWGAFAVLAGLVVLVLPLRPAKGE
ncbi:MAG TPA: MFS transporter [Jatrophihabitans sp.]|nr:MFS transporter [Jatrophihabitans sp.]